MENKSGKHKRKPKKHCVCCTIWNLHLVFCAMKEEQNPHKIESAAFCVKIMLRTEQFNPLTHTQTCMNPQPPSQFPNPLQSLFTGCQWSEPEAKVNHLQVLSAWLIAYIVFHLGVIEAQEWIQPARWSFITEVTLPAWSLQSQHLLIRKMFWSSLSSCARWLIWDHSK